MMPELTDAEPFGVLTAEEVIALEMHVLHPEYADHQLALIESIARAHERPALEGSAAMTLPTTASVIRANGNGPELMFGPDAADQWVTRDGEWWVGCDLTDVRVLWTAPVPRESKG